MRDCVIFCLSLSYRIFCALVSVCVHQDLPTCGESTTVVPTERCAATLHNDRGIGTHTEAKREEGDQRERTQKKGLASKNGNDKK